MTFPRSTGVGPADLRSCRLDPNPAGAGGGGAPPAPPAPTGGAVDAALIAKLVGENKGVNLDTPITMDGKAYTLKDLVTAHQQLASLGDVTELQRDAEAIKVLYGKDAKPEVAKPHMVRALVRAGHSEDEAKAQVEKLFKPAGPGAPGGDQEKEPSDAPIEPKLMQELVTERIAGSVTSQLNGAAMKPFLDGIKLRDGEEGYKATVQALEEEMSSSLKQALRARLDREKTFSIGWIAEEAATIAQKMAGKLRLLAGDPTKLGKSPSVTGEDPYSVLDEKPVPVATAQGKSRDQFDKDADARTTDRLARLARESVAGALV